MKIQERLKFYIDAITLRAAAPTTSSMGHTKKMSMTKSRSNDKPEERQGAPDSLNNKLLKCESCMQLDGLWEGWEPSSTLPE
jgi:hypothetical protein